MMPAPKTRRYRRILCGVDFSAQSASALRYAAALAADPGDTITAIHALDTTFRAASPSVSAFVASAQVDLDGFVARTLGTLTAARVKRVVAIGSPDAVVRAHAGRRKADGIIDEVAEDLHEGRGCHRDSR